MFMAQQLLHLCKKVSTHTNLLIWRETTMNTRELSELQFNYNFIERLWLEPWILFFIEKYGLNAKSNFQKMTILTYIFLKKLSFNLYIF